MSGKKCQPGCTCSRHSRSKDSFRSGSTKCEPGCTCKRHKRIISDEHRAKIVAANQARAGESHQCPPGCTCDRHKAHYRGGSKKGRVLSQKAIDNIAEAARNRTYTVEDKQRLAEQMRTNHADPEWEAKRVSALREALSGTTCPPGCACDKHSEETRQRIADAHIGLAHSEETKRRIGSASQRMWDAMSPEERAIVSARMSNGQRAVWEKERLEGRVRQTGGCFNSKHELSLIPYLEKLGYRHNTTLRVGRKVPDFVDVKNRRIFEYFGTYWHPEPLEEPWVTDYYRKLGWSCTVLWEHDLFTWLAEHEHLVTPEHHQAAWKAAHINNGFRKPSST